MSRIRAALGELPLLEAENKRQAGEKSEDGDSQTAPAQLVTSDGTYATQSAFSTASTRERSLLLPKMYVTFFICCLYMNVLIYREERRETTGIGAIYDGG